jgi:hypothetical protein
MKIKVVVIDVATPAWLRRAVSVALPALGVLASGIVLAEPKQWTSGEPLTATDLNHLDVLEVNGVKYSVGATHYCGIGPSPTTGHISFNGKTGYAGAKAMCEAAANCGPTAHMCDSNEIIRSAQVGDPLPSSAWYSVAVVAGAPPPLSGTVDDCKGWSSSISSDSGPIVQDASGKPGQRTCDLTANVACCD